MQTEHTKTETGINYFHTTGKNDIIEYTDVQLPEMLESQIMVKTILCGICRSDIFAYGGFEAPMPFLRQGHEGLGEVVKVGSEITDVKVGDLVATFSDPAYATYYYAGKEEYAIVPEATPKYILQPTACAINIARRTTRACISLNQTYVPKILLIGTGFMSLVIGQYYNHFGIKFDIVGSANPDKWEKLGAKLKTMQEVLDAKEQYDAVIDLSSKATNWDIIPKLLKIEGIMCYASTPYSPVTTNFFEQCWNCYSIIMPSPRNSDFGDVMRTTAKLITLGAIDPSEYWTAGYKRNDIYSVYQGFQDGSNRTPEYIRGYLEF